MELSLGMITIDTPDAARLSGWWAEQTGARAVFDQEGFVILAGGGLPAMLGFQQVADPTPGKNRVHLDLAAEDLEAAVTQLEAAGAGVVGRRGDDHFSWVTFTDPDGNAFCVSSREDAQAALT